MSQQPAEETTFHTRLMKCTLEIEHSRAYWEQCGRSDGPVSIDGAFEQATFGSRTYLRVERLMADMRHRFDAFPFALRVLSRWTQMDPQMRTLVCHWHVQLADPLYRTFAGEYLVQRHHAPRPVVDRDLVIAWIEEQVPKRWQLPTRIKIASKLMTSALSAGLITTSRDPRPVRFPQVSDVSLTYLMYVLREVQFDGTMLENPYVASVGLDTDSLVPRLRSLPALRFQRQGDLIDFGWQHNSLEDWAESLELLKPVTAEGGVR